MSTVEKNIAEAKLSESPSKKLTIKIKEGSVKPEHLDVDRLTDEVIYPIVDEMGKSGMTPQDKAKLDALPTNAQLQTALNSKQDNLTFDSIPTAESSNPVTSSGVKSYVDNHIPTTDAVPTSGSNNPVSSNGVYEALQNLYGEFYAE